VTTHNYEKKLSAQEIVALKPVKENQVGTRVYVKHDDYENKKPFLSRLTSWFPFGKKEEEKECCISRAEVASNDKSKVRLHTTGSIEPRDVPLDYKIAVRVVVRYDHRKHREK